MREKVLCDVMRRVFALLSLTLMPTLALAQPRSIDDCQSISQAMAYNECLASFGPAARHIRTARVIVPEEMETAPPAKIVTDIEAKSPHKPIIPKAFHMGSNMGSNMGSKRKRVVFDVGATGSTRKARHTMKAKPLKEESTVSSTASVASGPPVDR